MSNKRGWPSVTQINPLYTSEIEKYISEIGKPGVLRGFSHARFCSFKRGRLHGVWGMPNRGFRLCLKCLRPLK